ncbi:hypothetical protein BDF21DRAFT_477148 [Thamnidium elegans]|nr:hypothetical protein BDF21DRAFT_477148 [Thamnidium elegans]
MLADSPNINTNEVEEENVNSHTNETPNKKRKMLAMKCFRKLPISSKLEQLNEFCGIDNTLDFTKKYFIPQRFSDKVNLIKDYYGLKLSAVLRRDEYTLLKRVGTCHTKEELYHTVQEIDPFSNASNLPYIKLAVQKLCNLYHNTLLLNSNNNEVWYRIIVYGDLFDYVFAVQPCYITKRSDCHSSIIKSLKVLGLLSEDQQDVKLDFIFSNTVIASVGDAFFCEDKPTDRLSKKDEIKSFKLRQQSLLIGNISYHMMPA